MLIQKFVYGGKEYASERAVRQAIFKQEKKVFGKPETADQWAKLGVVYTEEERVIPLDVLKSQKADEIKQAFLNWRGQEATLVSSLGFKADSNERAMSDVNGLLVAYENNQDALITFRDADNQFHELSYTQVKVLQLEIIENGNFAYEQKWSFDAQVESATGEDELNAIHIEFVGKDFLN